MSFSTRGANPKIRHPPSPSLSFPLSAPPPSRWHITLGVFYNRGDTVSNLAVDWSRIQLWVVSNPAAALSYGQTYTSILLAISICFCLDLNYLLTWSFSLTISRPQSLSYQSRLSTLLSSTPQTYSSPILTVLYIISVFSAFSTIYIKLYPRRPRHQCVRWES